MKINELFEAIGTVGSTTDTVSPNGLPKTGAPPVNPQQQAQVKAGLNNIKGILGAAGGGNIDTNKLTQIMSQQTDPSKPMNPTMIKSLQSMLPGLSDALRTTQGASLIKQALKTGVDTQNKAVQAQTGVNQPQVGM